MASFFILLVYLFSSISPKELKRYYIAVYPTLAYQSDVMLPLHLRECCIVFLNAHQTQRCSRESRTATREEQVSVLNVTFR